MHRGEIWWANLPGPSGSGSGSGPGLRRPVVIVQSNAFNDSSISTVVVAALTSNLALAAAPGNMRVGKAASGLNKASVINVSQVLTLDRKYLSRRVKMLPTRNVNELNNGLRLCMGL